MGWARFDDRYDDHVKVILVTGRSPLAAAMHAQAITYCARHENDGAITDIFLVRYRGMRTRGEVTRAVDALVDAGLWEQTPTGWLVHDYLEFNPSKADLEREREWGRQRKSLGRDRELVAAIRARDADRCRYCGQQVDWKDRRGAQGGTYDHVIPRGPNTLENVVVACRHCNTSKNDRTPEQASMPLLDPGGLGPRSSPDLDRSQIGLGRSQDTRPGPARPYTHPNPSTAGGGMSESGDGEPPPGYLRSIEGGTT